MLQYLDLELQFLETQWLLPHVSAFDAPSSPMHPT